jgi:2-polyprenyl-3-methyl-5-hydroxy-6-metoxy-1,4-benzoquinol methylase
MRVCPICSTVNIIVPTILGRGEYTKCKECGLLYTHADVNFNTFADFYDGGRTNGRNYQDEYINNEADHNRNRALAKEMQQLCEESWNNKDILEIGSSAGYLLDEARRLGGRVKGVEISYAASDHANNTLNVHTVCSNWEVFAPEEYGWLDHFDFVLMAHVVEHFVDPYNAIRKINKVIRLGGAWITQHPDASVYPGVKFHVRDDTPKEHLQIFDEDTILRITNQLGFVRAVYLKQEPGQSVSVFRKVRCE